VLQPQAIVVDGEIWLMTSSREVDGRDAGPEGRSMGKHLLPEGKSVVRLVRNKAGRGHCRVARGVRWGIQRHSCYQGSVVLRDVRFIRG
jgi:hypothetical protein